MVYCGFQIGAHLALETEINRLHRKIDFRLETRYLNTGIRWIRLAFNLRRVLSDNRVSVASEFHKFNNLVLLATSESMRVERFFLSSKL